MNLQVDLRDIAPAKIAEAAHAFYPNARLMITAWQWSILKASGADRAMAEKVTVVAPDFLHYARLAGTGRTAEILRLPGSLGEVAQAAVACAPMGIKILPQLATGNFWAGALALTRYDVALLGRRFPGEVVLHPNLADFVCFFERGDLLRAFAGMTRGCGAWGISTQQLAAVLSLCARNNLAPQRLIYPTGMGRPETDVLVAAREKVFHKMLTTVDFTQWPVELVGAPDLYDYARPDDDTWLVSPATAVGL